MSCVIVNGKTACRRHNAVDMPKRLISRAMISSSVIALGILVTPVQAKLPETGNERNAVGLRRPLHLAQATLPKRELNVPAGALSDALVTLSQQTGRQISVDAALIRSLKSQGIAGRMTAKEALVKLLEGTGLKARRIGSSGLLITPPLVRTAQAQSDTTNDTSSAINLEGIVFMDLF